MFPEVLQPLVRRALPVTRGEGFPRTTDGEWTTPRVFTGALRDARAVTTWSERHLRDAHGTLEVTAKIIERPEDWFRPRQRFTRVTLAAALDTWVTPRDAEWPKCYVTVPLDPTWELADEAGVPAFVRAWMRPDEVLKRQLFLGRDGISKCHYHSDARTLLTQVVGGKHLVLFPPGDTRWLSPLPWFDVEHCWSRVDFLHPERWPDLAQTSPYVCSLVAGDALFIPPGWWHVVFGEGLSATVTYFWSAPHAPWRYAPDARMALRDALEWTLRRPVRRIQEGLGATIVRGRFR